MFYVFQFCDGTFRVDIMTWARNRATVADLKFAEQVYSSRREAERAVESYRSAPAALSAGL